MIVVTLSTHLLDSSGALTWLIPGPGGGYGVPSAQHCAVAYGQVGIYMAHMVHKALWSQLGLCVTTV